MRVRRAFTLIELLVVIAIIAVLIGILIPALATARRSARATVGVANLRSLSQIMTMYTSDAGGKFLSPFRPELWPLPGALGEYYFDAPRYAGERSTFWSFDVPPPIQEFRTEFFAYYWYSYMSVVSGKASLSTEQISPADSMLGDLVSQIRSAGLQDERVLWPSSYLYSPTFWCTPERYQSRDPLLPKHLLNMRMDSVSSPAAKVMIWERADFAQNRRVEFRDSGAKSANLAPAWANPRARPHAALVDGSVVKVDMEDLTRRVTNTDPDNRDGDLFPTGTYAALDGVPVLAPRGKIALDASASSSDASYPLFFWATRNGVRGRDLPR